MVEMRRSWMVGAGAAVLLLIVFFVAQHFLNADTYRGQIEASLSRSLGRPVQLGHLKFSLFSGSLVASAPSIADDPRFSTQPFLTAKDIRIGVETGAFLFHHEVHINGLTIDQPKITLLRGDNGTWNYSSIGRQSQTPASEASAGNLLPNLTVGSMEIKGGTLTIGTLPARAPAHVYSDLNLSAQSFALTKAFPFTVNGKLPNGGTVAINGTAGPIDQGDASLTPLSAQISLKHADLVAAGFVQPQQGISGMADLDAKVVSNGQTAQVDGTVHLTQLKLAATGTPSAEPVEVQYSIVQNLRALSGKVVSASVQVGHAAMSLNGSYQTTGNVTAVQLHAAGQQMPVDDLEGFLPSLGVHLPSGSRLRGGALTATLDISGPTTAPVISGPVRMTGAQLAGFDLGQRLSSIQALTGARTGGDTTIQVLDTNLHYGPDGTRAENLAVVVGGLGSAAGNGVISPGGGLDFHLRVKLDSGGVVGMATQALALLPGVFGSAVSRTTSDGIPLTISGTTANPVFRPDVGSVLGGAVRGSQPANTLGNVLGGLLHR